MSSGSSRNLPGTPAEPEATQRGGGMVTAFRVMLQSQLGRVARLSSMPRQLRHLARTHTSHRVPWDLGTPGAQLRQSTEHVQREGPPRTRRPCHASTPSPGDAPPNKSSPRPRPRRLHATIRGREEGEPDPASSPWAAEGPRLYRGGARTVHRTAWPRGPGGSLRGLCARPAPGRRPRRAVSSALPSE